MFAVYNIAVIAIIVFKEVHAPLRKGFRVCKFVFKASGVSGTGKVSGTGIHTELKTL